MSKRRQQKGFTLVELMLGMGFVGSLLVLIAIVIIQIMGLYNKGLTLKEVNEVTRIVVRDMQQSISSADAFRLMAEPQTRPDGSTPDPEVALSLEAVGLSGNGADYFNNPAGGRLCTGVYSYAWNTGAALKGLREAGGDATNYSFTSDGTGTFPVQTITTQDGDEVAVHFVKKRDPARSLCRADDTQPEKNRELGQEAEFQNVFGLGNDELVLYRFSIEERHNLKDNLDERSEVTALSSFYYVEMTLGTKNGDEDGGMGTVADTSCRAPGSGQAEGEEETLNNSEYCAINKLSFVARTGRGGN